MLVYCNGLYLSGLLDRPGALGRPGGSGWGGRWEGGSGWGRHVNPRPFHFNVLQNSLQIKKINKIQARDKWKKKKKELK